MNILGAVTSYVDWGVNSTAKVANNIVSNPSAVKKTGQLLSSVVQALNYYNGQDYIPDLIKNIKGTNELIDIYGSFKNIVFWINPFQIEKLDQQKFIGTLKLALMDPCFKLTKEIDKEIDSVKDAETIVKELLKGNQGIVTQRDVYVALEKSLIQQGYTLEQAKAIIEKTEVNLKPRSFLTLLSTAAFTIAGLASNLLMLEKWKIVDLAQVANKIGSEFKAFGSIVTFSLSKTITTLAVFGTGVTWIDAINKFIKAQKATQVADTVNEKKNAELEKSRSIWDLGTSSINLISATLPLAFALNPPVMISLAIFTQGTGLISILCKP